jgi:hypothetical protein
MSNAKKGIYWHQDLWAQEHGNGLARQAGEATLVELRHDRQGMKGMGRFVLLILLYISSSDREVVQVPMGYRT